MECQDYGQSLQVYSIFEQMKERMLEFVEESLQKGTLRSLALWHYVMGRMLYFE